MQNSNQSGYRILGIDPGSRRTGYGIVDVSDEGVTPVHFGVIDTGGGDPPPEEGPPLNGCGVVDVGLDYSSGFTESTLDLINTVTMAMLSEATVGDLMRLIPRHPSTGEALVAS